MISDIRNLEDDIDDGDQLLVHCGASLFVFEGAIVDAIHVCLLNGNASTTHSRSS